MLFLGHSLGGACSILAAAKLQSDKIRGVVLLSAQVSKMRQSPVNDDICERRPVLGKGRHILTGLSGTALMRGLLNAAAGWQPRGNAHCRWEKGA
jgi:alpha-beta hydrolase superfamily lysophospholipase